MSSSPTTSPRRSLKSANLDDLKQQQLDALATEDGKGDIPHLKGNTPAGKDYELPPHESHVMHIELVRFAQIPGTRDFDRVAKIIKPSPAEFERMEKNDSFAEYQSEDNPGEVNILFDPRPKARQKADLTGDVKTGSPAEPQKPLATLNDAQMRYFELTKQQAPADLTLGQLIDKIAELEAAKGAEKTTPGADDAKKPMRSLEDAQRRYKELVGRAAPEDKTFTELKEAIKHFESPEGAADLTALRAE